MRSYQHLHRYRSLWVVVAQQQVPPWWAKEENKEMTVVCLCLLYEVF